MIGTELAGCRMIVVNGVAVCNDDSWLDIADTEDFCGSLDELRTGVSSVAFSAATVVPAGFCTLTGTFLIFSGLISFKAVPLIAGLAFTGTTVSSTAVGAR